LVADVQFWADHPDQNYGWIVISESESTPYTARRFGSREDPPNAPTLQLEYIPQPRIDATQVNGNQFSLSFVVPAGLSSSVQSLDSLSNTNWATITNFPASLAARTDVVSTLLTGARVFIALVSNKRAGAGGLGGTGAMRAPLAFLCRKLCRKLVELLGQNGG